MAKKIIFWIAVILIILALGIWYFSSGNNDGDLNYASGGSGVENAAGGEVDVLIADSLLDEGDDVELGGLI